MARIRRAPPGELLSLPWWSWWPRRRYTVLGSVDAADLIPDRLPRRGLAVVEDSTGPSWVAFDCPCSRRHRLLIRLGATHHPHWLLDTSQHASLMPSVDSHDGGHRCHFWLTKGKIRWARDTGN